MFATLVGKNTALEECQTLFRRLSEIAVSRGFTPPDTPYPIQSDKIPLEGWTLELTGPEENNADFFSLSLLRKHR